MFLDDMESDAVYEDLFKEQFKYYKANKPLPLLDNVLKISQNNHQTDKIVQNFPDVTAVKDNRTRLLGLIDSTQWKIYTFKSHPGLIFIKNPFTSLGQRYWIQKCLEEYTRKPNKSNLDYEIKIEDWWRDCYRDGQCDRSLQKKMRWTTLGYHHNWDTKVYSEDSKDLFPEELAELCDVVARSLGYHAFRPQAAIINYYHMDSTLSPHTDHSEINLEAPLFSFSFGQSAIFLIGGKNKDVRPSAIMLNSGDILIMSKLARLCYHAVPKILPTSETPWNIADTLLDDNKNTSLTYDLKYIIDPKEIEKNMEKNNEELIWHRFNTYINQSRININVRQVLNENQNFM